MERMAQGLHTGDVNNIIAPNEQQRLWAAQAQALHRQVDRATYELRLQCLQLAVAASAGDPVQEAGRYMRFIQAADAATTAPDA